MITLIVFKFVYHLILGISGTDKLVRHFDFVEPALFKQYQVLFVTDLSLFTSFQFLPCLVLNHGSVSVEVLSLKFDFF